LLLSLFFLPHWLKNRLSTTQRLYLNSLRVLEKAGAPRSIWQGPSAFSQQINEHYSYKVSEPFSHITQHYLRLTYQNKHTCEAPILNTKKCHRIMRHHLALLKTELLNIKT
jgi:hypothetical protein